ncbi:MAG: class I tRNA ligase family protein [Candidatus Komeilibacteria bacterium]
MSKELAKIYQPGEWEDKIYQQWEEEGYFNPDVCVEQGIALPAAPSFTIILPPPNITDKLHLGHGVMLALEDIMIRYHRMLGERALWVPGTDHAAIATQNVVEKILLQEEKKSRHDLGRLQFLDRVWQFVAKTQSTILQQIRKSGASLDWSREAFTLDAQRQRAVQRMFVDMYEAGIIYRGHRIVNWCPRCQSTLADDEVEYQEQPAQLYTFTYDKDFPIPISTTRPETKLGDTAVAVHPQDKRYKKFLGQELSANFCGQPLRIKIIADEAVDPDYGTGALGVTPAHSMVDYEMAQKNNLSIIKVIDEDGRMMPSLGGFSGLPVKEARAEIVKLLQEQGLLQSMEDIKNNLSICYRCGTAIEPLTSRQWFIAVDKPVKRLHKKSLKQAAIDLAKQGEVQFVPERFTKRYLDWMENLHDWCISRQIWFGHRIPVWYKGDINDNPEIKVPHQITQVAITRHGLTDWNKDGIVQGQSNVPLDEQSIEQIYDFADKIKQHGYTAIVSSPLQRARQTAEIIAEKLKLPVVIEPLVRERDYGVFEGKAVKDIKQSDPDYYKDKINYKISGAETYDEMQKRAEKFLQKMDKEFPGQKVLVISHNAFMRSLRRLNSHDDNATLSDYRPSFGELATYNILDGEYKLADWRQDEDSLDTWFSSGMWTFSTLGWPDNIKGDKKIGDLAAFHPTQVMETGYEIITLWVSRMIMMSLFALGEKPFSQVYLHGMILDEHGKKMSKSKGNGIDPLDVIDKYGADAMRLSLVLGATPGNDARIGETKIAAFRNFTNKLWNIARYILSSVDMSMADQEIESDQLTIADIWIMDRMGELIVSTREDIENFRFASAGEKMRDFTWNDLADWYIEVSKYEQTVNKSIILARILLDLLKLWHPYMPFVTEAIWQQSGQSGFIMVQSYPMVDWYHNIVDQDQIAGQRFVILQNIISAIRNILSEYNVPSGQKINVTLITKEHGDWLQNEIELLESLRTQVGKLKIVDSGNRPSQSAYTVVDKVEIVVPLAGLIDIAAELKRITQRIAELDNLIVGINKKLANQNFVQRAPQEVVDAEKAKQEQYQVEKDKLLGRKQNLQ